MLRMLDCGEEACSFGVRRDTAQPHTRAAATQSVGRRVSNTILKGLTRIDTANT